MIWEKVLNKSGLFILKLNKEFNISSVYIFKMFFITIFHTSRPRIFGAYNQRVGHRCHQSSACRWICV